MKTARRKSNSDPKSQTLSEQLLVGDIARYLDRLAWLSRDDKTGNAELSNELQRLSDMLRPHGRLTVSELTITGVDAKPSSKPPASSRNGKTTAGKREDAAAPTSLTESDLRSLSEEEVELFLEYNTLTKQQLAEFGHVRFGISESSLLRLSKPRARKKILAALKTERMMRIVAEQARRAGEMRSA